MLWFMTREAYGTDDRKVRDWLKYPELRLLERFDFVAPALLAVSMFMLGEVIQAVWPGSGTSGPQMLVWGFIISTITLYHVTFGINSLAHTYGSRRYDTNDDSRNNFWLALVTLGEGWHNNHHRFAHAARQGFYWFEVDFTWYGLKFLESVRLISDLRPVPAHVYEEAAKNSSAAA
jgi:stearoyl-CoA desaturase (delta-9 desaturase)